MMPSRSVIAFICRMLASVALLAAIPRAAAAQATAAKADEAAPLVKITTTMGDIVVELDPQGAPETVANFLGYIERGFYNGTTFHRVVRNHLIQGGGFKADGSPKPPEAPIKNESTTTAHHVRGTVAMARSSDNPHSATSQFFINVADNPTLDADPAGTGHAIFGKVVAGMRVVDAIRQVPVGKSGMGEVTQPVNPVIILSARRVALKDVKPLIDAEATAATSPPPAADAPVAPTSFTPDNVPKVAYVSLATSKGSILLQLDGAKAPISVANFLNYVGSGFYDQTIFHRVMSNFMIQGGGFDGNMVQKPTQPPIKNEWQNGLKNVRGSIAMARLGQQPDSATAQFFINVVDNPMLDEARDGAGYAVFGKVASGMNAVDAIKLVPTTTKGTHQNVPVETVYIMKASLVSEEGAQKILAREQAGQ